MRSLRALLTALLLVLAALTWQVYRLVESLDRWEPVRRAIEGVGIE